jgi:hypothetical protein
MTNEEHVNQKFAILAATAFYGPNVERSFGRPPLVRNKKADALWLALPEPARTFAVEAKVAWCSLLNGEPGTQQ